MLFDLYSVQAIEPRRLEETVGLDGEPEWSSRGYASR